jgi:putative heme-binding domain-containing protein
MRDEKALPLLLAALRSERAREPLCDTALASVESIGGQPAREGLIQLLSDTAFEVEHQPRVIAALGRFAAKAAVPVLLQKLTSPAAPVRAAAAEALGRIGVREAVGGPLIARLDDSDLEVRKAAITALGRLDERAAIPGLLAAASAEASEFEATEALARMPDARALQVYLRGLGHKNLDLRRESANAIRRIREQAIPILDELAHRRELAPSLLPELRNVFTTPEPIRSWHVVGPFPMRERTPFDTARPIDLDQPLKGEGGQSVRWKPADASEADGSIDLEKLVSNDPNRAAYAYAEHESPSARRAELVVGSDDTLSVWVNGKRALQFRGERGFEPDQDRAPISLERGINRILVRCGNRAGAWRFAVAVTRPADYAFLKGPNDAGNAFDPEVYRRLALEEKGRADRGRELFHDPKGIGCIKCHAVAGQGGTVGPELSTIGTKYSRDELIQSVLFPSARISSGYEATIVATSDGRVLTGLVKSETPQTLELIDASATRLNITKSDIEDRKPANLSVMPNGLAERLSAQDFADLIAYLQALKEGARGEGGK